MGQSALPDSCLNEAGETCCTARPSSSLAASIWPPFFTRSSLSSPTQGRSGRPLAVSCGGSCGRRRRALDTTEQPPSEAPLGISAGAAGEKEGALRLSPWRQPPPRLMCASLSWAQLLHAQPALARTPRGLEAFRHLLQPTRRHPRLRDSLDRAYLADQSREQDRQAQGTQGLDLPRRGFLRRTRRTRGLALDNSVALARGSSSGRGIECRRVSGCPVSCSSCRGRPFGRPLPSWAGAERHG
jgi:hypothetical protein